MFQSIPCSRLNQNHCLKSKDYKEDSDTIKVELRSNKHSCKFLKYHSTNVFLKQLQQRDIISKQFFKHIIFLS